MRTTKNIDEAYREKSWLERWRTIFFGIKQNKETRPYKEAIIEIIHKVAKVVAFIVCVIAITILLLWKVERRIPEPVNTPVNIIEIDDPVVLDPPEPPEVVNPDVNALDNDIELPGFEDTPLVQDPEPTITEVSIKPAEITTVTPVKSPIAFAGVRAGDGGQRGGNFGYGGGSALATDMIGYMIDLKQGDHCNLSFRAAVKELLDSKWSKDALSHYFVATNRLYLNYLFVESQPAENGPAAFGCQDQVQPRKWIAHYEGRLNPFRAGEYRFVGHFDDLLIVMVDDEPVLDAYWQMHESYKAGGKSEITGWKPDEKSEVFQKHQSFSGQKLIHGDWMMLTPGCNKKIDIIIGEEPGGVVGGVLLLEERNTEYATDAIGRKILPLFAMSRLEKFEADAVTNSMARMRFAVEVDPLRLPIMNYKAPERSTKPPKNPNEVRVNVIRKD